MINIIEQKQSVNSMVNEGTDWNGRRIPKRIIQKSLEFESLFKGIDEVWLSNSWSDYPPSYCLSLKIKDVIPSKNGFKRKVDNYSNVFEVFPQRDGYHIRDRRILSELRNESISPFCNHKVDSLKELIELLFNSEFSLDVFTEMKIKDVNSSSELRSEEQTDDYIRKFSEETFDFNKDELKEKLIQRFEEDEINSILSESGIKTIKK